MTTVAETLIVYFSATVSVFFSVLRLNVKKRPLSAFREESSLQTQVG